MNLKDLQETVRETSEKHGYDEESLEQKLLLLVEEVGELAKSIRKKVGTSVGKHSNEHNPKDEVADVLYVLTDIANELGISLDEAFLTKLDHINRRSK